MAPQYQLSSGGASVDVDGITDFLQNLGINNQKRPSRLTNGSDWVTELPSVPHTSSGPRTRGSSSGFVSQLHARESLASAGSSSYMLSTVASSVFDTNASTSSESTVLDPADEIEPIYQCEFIDYTNCNLWYWQGAEEEWFDHIAIDHMENKFPRESWCWYCNKVFEPKDNENRKDAFHRRMMHIGSHIRNGTQQGRRPDHPLITHLHKRDLVDDWVLAAARTFHEAPQPRNMDFTRLSQHAHGRNAPKPRRERSRGHRSGGHGGHRHRETQTVARRGGEWEYEQNYHY